MVNFKSLLGELVVFSYIQYSCQLYLIRIAQATDPSLKEPDLGATFDFVEEIQRNKSKG